MGIIPESANMSYWEKLKSYASFVLNFQVLSNSSRRWTVYESVIEGFGSLIISDTDLTGEKKMKHADFVLYCDKS